MKTLHESKFDTESGSRAYTAVCAGLTPTGEPFRRVVVEVNAEMGPGEVRKLITNLQHDLSLAEESPAVECVCGTVPGSYDGPLPECDVHGLPSAAYKAGYAMAEADAVQMKALDRPAVSEDQPKPRVWHKGDAEPPADVTVLEDEDGDQLTRTSNGGWLWTRISGRDHTVPPKWTGVLWGYLDWDGYTRLSEVLPDSEAVTG